MVMIMVVMVVVWPPLFVLLGVYREQVPCPVIVGVFACSLTPYNTSSGSIVPITTAAAAATTCRGLILTTAAERSGGGRVATRTAADVA